MRKVYLVTDKAGRIKLARADHLKHRTISMRLHSMRSKNFEFFGYHLCHGDLGCGMFPQHQADLDMLAAWA